MPTEKSKVLITGSTGFVGFNILQHLYKYNYKIRCLVRKTSNVSKLLPYNVELVYGDITERNIPFETVEGIDYVIHCAATKRAVSKKDYYKVNVEGTKNLLNLLLKNKQKIKKVIIISSQASSGPSPYFHFKTIDSHDNPISDYGLSKLLMEKEVEKVNNEIPVVILRPSTIYGPFDKDLLPIFKFARNGFGPLLNNSYFQLLFVKDLAEICRRLLVNNISSKKYFVAEDKFYNWLSIFETFEKIFNKKILKISIPYQILKISSYLDEFYSILKGKPALLSRQKLKELTSKYWLCDVSEIKKDLNFNFTPLEVGLRHTCSWYYENNWLHK